MTDKSVKKEKDIENRFFCIKKELVKKTILNTYSGFEINSKCLELATKRMERTLCSMRF